MKSSARRGSEILNHMLLFTRGSTSTCLTLEPADIVAEIADLLSKVLPINIQLQVEAAAPQYRFQANPTQVHQVLMNLCINARDAMPYGGIIKIRARSQSFQKHAVMGQAETVSGAYVGLSVSDSGHGMSPEVLSHIFEPFFTTKPPGLGTGLGLAIVTGVVRNHHGFLEVRSAMGKGSTFTAWFPAMPEPAT
jgi:signal transduction histidine kinase